MIHGACVTRCSRPKRVRGAPLSWWCGPFAETVVRNAAVYAGRELGASFFGVDGTAKSAAHVVTSGGVRLTTRATIVADASFVLRRVSTRNHLLGRTSGT